MTTIEDVRKAFWLAYIKLAQNGGIEGKFSEGLMEVTYPTYWDCEREEDFSQPIQIDLYSYALGPSRMHHIIKKGADHKPNYYTWETRNVIETALKVIAEWDKELDTQIADEF
jgi:hypothetical protein